MARNETDGGCGQAPMPPSNYNQAKQSAQVNRLSIDSMGTDPVGLPVRERVYNELYRGHEHQRRFERAQRAAVLIEKHPEIAELVELLREF